MSVQTKLEPIYNLVINSSEDLENVLNYSDQNNQKISQILEVYYSHKIDQTSHYLNLSSLFKDAYWGSLCFHTSSDLIKDIHRYKHLLDHSIRTCGDITSLLMRSFKHQQTASHSFKAGPSSKSCVPIMAETGKIAEQIASEYENLSEQFIKLREDISKIMIALVRNRAHLYKLRNTIIPSEKIRLITLTRGIDSLDKTIDTTFWNIQSALVNMHVFWRSAEHQSQSLANPNLADAAYAEMITDNPHLEEPVKNFWDSLEQTEKDTHIILPNPQPIKTLEDVVKSMKSGTKTLSNPPKSFVNLFKPSIVHSIEEEFEQSYLKWLALAKVNLEIITAMEDARAEIGKIQTAILQAEKDPLVIALHKSASNS